MTMTLVERRNTDLAQREDGNFMESAVSTALAVNEAGTMSNVVREEAELKTAIVLARSMPRNETSSFAKLMSSCKRPSFASRAMYAFPRAGQTITGPSVKLAREMARCWGNIRSGVRIVTMDENWVHIRGYALDLETNALVEAEDKFEKLIFRKKGGWVKPDERDLRELVNRRGSFVLRNCLLHLMPFDVTEEACIEARRTMDKAAAGELKMSKQDTIRNLAVAFNGLGVTTQMLTDYLKHPLEQISPEELTNLRGVYSSISEGHTRPAEHFESAAPQPSQSAKDIESRLSNPPTPVTKKPVSEGQTFEPDAEAGDRVAAQDAVMSPPPPQSTQSSPDVSTWEKTREALTDASMDANTPEGDVFKRVDLWLVSKGAKGNENAKTTPEDRAALVDAVRRKLLNHQGKIIGNNG